MKLIALSSTALLCALAFCGFDAESNVEAQPRAAKPGTKVVLGQSQFGRILFNAGNQAIYMFETETTKKPECYGACAKVWPPVYAKGKPRLGPGLRRSLLGTTKRSNGRPQITYGGHPLYYYAHEGPDEVLCHNVVEFGGKWLALRRSGQPVPPNG
jgi:predicted lipoprotein with Yx(FWY)xxD motif